MELKMLINACHQTAKEKGFWDNKRNIGELLMLVVSELGEALEADRQDRHAAPERMPLYRAADADRVFVECFNEHIKGTFEEEIADTVIRIFDLCGGLGINLEYYIETKMRYNSTRERLHGKKY